MIDLLGKDILRVRLEYRFTYDISDSRMIKIVQELFMQLLKGCAWQINFELSGSIFRSFMELKTKYENVEIMSEINGRIASQERKEFKAI